MNTLKSPLCTIIFISFYFFLQGSSGFTTTLESVCFIIRSNIKNNSRKLMHTLKALRTLESLYLFIFSFLCHFIFTSLYNFILFLYHFIFIFVLFYFSSLYRFNLFIFVSFYFPILSLYHFIFYLYIILFSHFCIILFCYFICLSLYYFIFSYYLCIIYAYFWLHKILHTLSRVVGKQLRPL